MKAGPLIVLLLTGASAAWAAAGEPEAKPEPWSSPQRGLAVLLKAVNPEVTEVTGVPTDPAGRIEFQLLVKNVSGKPLGLKVEPLDEAGMQWAISGADGSRWTPVFSGAKAGGGGASRKLEPDEVFAYAALQGMAMFARAGEAVSAARSMLPAGTYTMAAQNLRLPEAGSFATNPVTVRVLSADRPVDGLKLALTAEKAETARGPDGQQPVPVKLKLTFSNVGDKPIKLNLFNLAWASLGPEAELGGNVPAGLSASRLPARAPPAPKPEDYPTLEPGQSRVFEGLSFPGDCGRNHYALTGPAGTLTCRLRISYKPKPHAPAAGDRLAQGCWAGKVQSNEIAFSIR